MVTDLPSKQSYILHMKMEVFYETGNVPALTIPILNHMTVPRLPCSQQTMYLDTGKTDMY